MNLSRISKVNAASMDILQIETDQSEWEALLPNVAVQWQAVAAETLRRAGKPALPVNVLLTDDAAVRDLNAQFRGKDKPTNVLSFPSGDDEEYGDIALAYETIAKEAAEQGKELAAHSTHLLVHGLLHLLGFDHEQEGEAEAMEALEVKILQQFHIDNPYKEQ